MSWLLGLAECGDLSVVDCAVAAVGLRPLHRCARVRTFFAAGGIPETCVCSVLDGARPVLEIELGTRLESAHQTVVVRLEADELTIRNDPLALRTMYLRKWQGGLVFSTRLDLLAAVTDPRDLHIDVLGAQWLTFNRWTSDPMVTDTVALGQGGSAVYRDGELTLTNRPWMPGDVREESASLAEVLRCHASSPDASLGLSGGLDSRVLLALLLGSGARPGLHVFGTDVDPDVRLAKRIAQAHDLDLQHLVETLPSVDECLTLVRRHAAESQVAVPASQALKVHPYDTLHRQGLMVVDGGFGEIARRQFLNRLLVRAPRHLCDLNAEGMLPFVTFDRGSLFAPEVAARMRSGATEQLARALDDLRDFPADSAEDLADLLCIRTRLPWYFGIEQARMDGHVRSHMPFATPEALDRVMRTPLVRRRRGRLMKRLIRTNSPSLAHVPLAKGDLALPFSAPREVAWVVARLRVRRSRPTASFRDTFLSHVEPFVRDLVDSREVRECALYDAARISDLVRRYYAGERSLGAALDWFLALELWRQGVRV
ncbi:MAG TPA: hypothetical protein VF190_02140 [Rhodothermales bacterium]